MRLYSAYRAVSSRGIGNSPGSTSLYGDQYLRVDKELWDTPLLPEQMRPWLTFVPPETRSGEALPTFESWSIFSIGQWHVVARMCAFSVDEQGRPTYYCHARAWLNGEWMREPNRD